jgi:hypothetical protein
MFIEVKEVISNENVLTFDAAADRDISSLQPSGKMLVDSEHFSFVYLLEDTDAYIYLRVPDSMWPTIKEGMNENKAIVLKANDHLMELTNFHEELEYLISNIKGNSNYGDEMVKKVEHAFLTDMG